jgi:hypothetical protein
VLDVLVLDVLVLDVLVLDVLVLEAVVMSEVVEDFSSWEVNFVSTISLMSLIVDKFL